MSEEVEKVNLIISGRTYSLQVNRRQIEQVKEAAKTINKRLAELQRKYSQSDKQDCMSMLLLTLAIENLDATTKSSQSEENNHLVEEIELLLSSI